jgi:hypothetical protein
VGVFGRRVRITLVGGETPQGRYAMKVWDVGVMTLVRGVAIAHKMALFHGGSGYLYRGVSGLVITNEPAPQMGDLVGVYRVG